MSKVYSRHPDYMGQHYIICDEMMMVQYMPVMMPNSPLRIPRHLQCFEALVFDVIDMVEDPDCYVYLTAKHMYVGAGMTPNRPGWHIDGFGTQDRNFIWSSSMPTEFCVNQEFDLCDDHELSLLQMEAQVNPDNVITYLDNTLVGLDNTIVHRVNPVTVPGLRTFCKISVSKERYNLKGNAHNYLFDYDWPMVDRQLERNHPIGAKP